MSGGRIDVGGFGGSGSWVIASHSKLTVKHFCDSPNFDSDSALSSPPPNKHCKKFVHNTGEEIKH